MVKSQASKTSTTSVKCGSRNRYKGIENFLRRIAFNLGNTPSKTQVKIVSCIPIDVSDLQQKINTLEKQLETARCKQPRSCPGRKYSSPPPSSPSTTPSYVPECKVQCQPTLTKPAVFSKTRVQYFTVPYNDNHVSQPVTINKVVENTSPKKNKKPDLSSYVKDTAKHNLKPRTKNTVRQSPNLFGRVISDKDRTKLVYYAQTQRNPFDNFNANGTEKSNQRMDREYISSLLDRHQQMKMYTGGNMLGGKGSVPVCRDERRRSGTSNDMCSCCGGNFLDIDRKLRKRPIFSPNIDHGNIYYDSSFYDMRPVKEKAGKNGEPVKKRAPEVDRTFLSEYYRFKPEYFNYSMAHDRGDKKPIQKKERCEKPVYLPNDSSATEGLVEFSHVYPKRLLPKREFVYITKEEVSRNAECNVRSDNTEFCIRPSKPISTPPGTKLESTFDHLIKPLTGSFECAQPIHSATGSTRQMKALQTSLSRVKSTHDCINVKNAACLALPVIEIECQTDSFKAAQPDSSSPPDKTESTLNQIKNMLETVLVEVKTNNVVRTIVSEKETKDATVQNEHGPPSECERLLNTFTYSPYSMINPYMPSCSHALPSYYSSMMRQTLTIPRHEMPPSDLTQFPEMVHQALAAHSCFPDRNAMHPKQTTTATCATNTLPEPPKKRNTETEDLIKEIYKSIKLDVDYPEKIDSHSVITQNKSNGVNEALASGRTAMGREEIVFRGDVSTSRAARGSRSSHSSLTRPNRRHSLHQQPKHITSSQRRQGISKGTNKDSHGSDSDSASDCDILLPAVTPARNLTKPSIKGFFGKVASVVNKMRKKEEKQVSDKRADAGTQDSESSDFDTRDITPRDRPVKHVSYAPAAAETWAVGQSARPLNSSSKTRRLGQRTVCPTYPIQRMPRYNPPRPRSVIRAHALAGSSQGRRTLYRPQTPNRPRTPPEYMKKVPRNQYDWRTTPTKSGHRITPMPTNEYRPRIPTKNPGLKITNKNWMRKPVYHLGFACGPEKEKIMQR